MGRSGVSPLAFRRIALAALVANVAIIVTGATVRLTESGMGCPTWPKCEPGSLVPQDAASYHAWIEFGNRLFAVVVTAAVVATVLAARARAPRRRDLVWLSWGLVAGVLTQSLVGGLVVIFHVAPPSVMVHYLLSSLLVLNATVLYHRAGEPAGARRWRVEPPLVRVGRALVAAACVVLVTGTVVTGTGPHGGDDRAWRLGFDLSTVANVHTAAVWTFLGIALTTLWMARRSREPVVISRAKVLIGAIAAQGLIGYVQFFSGLPEPLVLGHVLGSVLVWIAVIRVWLALSEPVPEAEAPPEPGSRQPGEPVPVLSPTT